MSPFRVTLRLAAVSAFIFSAAAYAQPLISKSFTPTTVASGGTSTLTVVVTSVPGDANVGFTDLFPAGLTLAAAATATAPACSLGSTGGTVSGVAGGSVVSVSGGNIAPNGQCFYTFSVRGTLPTGGPLMNTITVVGATGQGNTASDTLTIAGPLALSPPAIVKSFTPPSIAGGATTTLNFTVSNPGATTLTGVTFTDTLTGGLQVAAPGATAVICTAGSTGGVPSAAIGGVTVTLPATTLAAGGSCSFSVTVLGTALAPAPGITNSVTVIDNVANLVGNTATAAITVVPGAVTLPPVIAKAFGGTTVALNGTTNLTFTLTNPNAATALAGVTFSDALAGLGLTVAAAPVITCTPGSTAGTVTATVGTTSIAVATPFTLAANGVCTITVGVTGTATAPGGGVTNNTTAVSAVIGGVAVPGNIGTAAITVLGPPTVTKAFSPNPIPVGGTATLSFTVNNPNVAGTPSLTGIALSDTLAAGLVIATPTAATVGTCAGATLTGVAGTTAINLTGLTLAANTSCTFSINVLNTGGVGIIPNVTGSITSANGGTGGIATAGLTLLPLDAFQVRYVANLNISDAYINLTNVGTVNGFDPAGRICVNVYAFDPAEELIGCCACEVTPNGLNSLSARNDLISNTLTPGVPTSITIKLVANYPVDTKGARVGCNAAGVTGANLAAGLRAWASTSHALPTTPVTYGMTETPFSPAQLSASELSKMSSYCGFIQATGSGYGICKSCRLGGLGTDKK